MTLSTLSLNMQNHLENFQNKFFELWRNSEPGMPQIPEQDCRKLLLEAHREHKWSLCVPKIGGKLQSLKPMMLPTQKQEGKSINRLRQSLIFLSHKPGEFKGTAKCTLLMGIVTHSFSHTVSADASTGAMKPFIFCPKFLLSSKTEQWMGIQFSWEQYLI